MVKENKDRKYQPAAVVGKNGEPEEPFFAAVAARETEKQRSTGSRCSSQGGLRRNTGAARSTGSSPRGGLPGKEASSRRLSPSGREVAPPGVSVWPASSFCVKRREETMCSSCA
nr:hypothetical protein Iba_scaffold21693CG0010 [Ipomoea batatas]